MEPFDFTYLDAFTKEVPHGALAQLRREAPVYWNPLPSSIRANDGFWLITKYEDILQIEKNTHLFSSHYGLTLADSPPPMCGPPWSMVRDGLTHLDPPMHMVHKRLIAPSFTPRAIGGLEGRIRTIASDVLDRATRMDSFDFASEVALRFPVTVVLGEVLGLPPEDFERVIYWSDVILAPNEPGVPRSAGFKVVHEVYDYAMNILASRRREQTGDVLSMLAHSQDADGTNISDEAFVRYFWSLVTAAFDTTASAISGGMLALLTFPGEYERLLRDPALLPSAVEEVLRWVTPTIYFRRTAMEDTEMRGRSIVRGQRVVMCYASGNRDEDAFRSPEVFDIGRKPNDHLSFGYGTHFCLGAGLARLEIRVLLEQIMQRRLHLESRGEIRRARSNFQNRIKVMPVTVCAG